MRRARRVQGSELAACGRKRAACNGPAIRPRRELDAGFGRNGGPLRAQGSGERGRPGAGAL